jgi:lipoprotein-anchoring transpeptidase ErfK/SrfK
MRRLARLSCSMLLCAVTGPALAGNGGFMILGLQGSKASAEGAPGVAPPVPVPAPASAQAGGGLIGLLLTGGGSQQTQTAALTASDPAMEADGEPEPRFQRQEVNYAGEEAPGTLVVDTPDKFLFLVEPHGKALRYGIGVGRPGFEWAGIKRISRKAEWPDWTPPPQMLLRRPDLPRHMAGGPDNPLGARALYLGSSLYRIHGTNEPSTIGHNVSSGCIRMMNEDVIDLYNRVPLGAKVIVL